MLNFMPGQGNEEQNQGMGSGDYGQDNRGRQNNQDGQKSGGDEQKKSRSDMESRGDNDKKNR
jgi:hypothetical protein